jgi:probable F420-dependent oxidoreductase
MTEVAGEVCDGFLVHPFTTRRYLDEVTIPALERGRAAGGQSGLDGFVVSGRAFIVVGRDDEELAAAARGAKQQIAFYASTPAYKSVLDLHDRGELQPELTRLSKEGRWTDMADVIDDELLGLMAVIGDPETVGRGVAERWGGTYDRVSLYLTYQIDDGTLNATADALRNAVREA